MKAICLFLFCVLNLILFGQDVHWSLIKENKSNFNPATLGSFDGDTKLILSYRDQWRSVTVPFQTFRTAIEFKSMKYKKWKNGVDFFYDNVGDGAFKTIQINYLSAYEVFTSKDQRQKVNVGIAAGLNQRSFKFNHFYFDEQFNGLFYDPNLPITEDLSRDKRTNFTSSLGINYSNKISSNLDLILGSSIANLFHGNMSFYDEKIQRYKRFLLQIELDYKVNDKILISPTVLFQKQGPYRSFIALSQVSFNLKKQQQFILGLGLRNNDAILFQVGLLYSKWKLMANYDWNFSTFTPATNNRGGFELNFSYIFKKIKPKINYYISCPEYI